MDWPYVNRYQCRVSSQPARLEILQDLYTCKRTAGGQMQHGGTVRELLIAFYQATGQKPARIIMFRSVRRTRARMPASAFHCRSYKSTILVLQKAVGTWVLGPRTVEAKSSRKLQNGTKRQLGTDLS